MSHIRRDFGTQAKPAENAANTPQLFSAVYKTAT